MCNVCSLVAYKGWDTTVSWAGSKYQTYVKTMENLLYSFFLLPVLSNCTEVQKKIPTSPNRTVHYEGTRNYIFLTELQESWRQWSVAYVRSHGQTGLSSAAYGWLVAGDTATKGYIRHP